MIYCTDSRYYCGSVTEGNALNLYKDLNMLFIYKIYVIFTKLFI